ncbi:MAG: acyl carrier protein [Opitutaceae bacterium]|jgi:acyl carrier protein
MNEEKLRKCFSEALNLPADQIVDNLAYQAIKQWDSIAHMALIAALEGEFNVMFDTDEILALSSVAVARELLKKHEVAFP